MDFPRLPELVEYQHRAMKDETNEARDGKCDDPKNGTQFRNNSTSDFAISGWRKERERKKRRKEGGNRERG